MAWKLKFDAERAEMRRLNGLSDGSAKKPTGNFTFKCLDNVHVWT